MNNQSQLEPILKSLKLGGMLETLEVRNQEAISRKATYLDFLTLILEDEIERRKAGKLRELLRRGGFDPNKTLENFDFSFNRTINQKQLFDLAACRFVERSENVWFCGPSGVGKSHLAMALAHHACRREMETLCLGTDKMLAHLNGGRADGTYATRLRKYTRPALLVLDEFCLKRLKDQEPEDLYEVISQRHEKSATIITSNRAYREWPEALGDPLIASALLDRLAHNSHQIEITGKSYRTKNLTRYASGFSGLHGRTPGRREPPGGNHGEGQPPEPDLPAGSPKISPGLKARAKANDPECL